MYSNKITSIERGDFTGLGNLTTLSDIAMLFIALVLRSYVAHRHLHWNQISSIESGGFAGLGNLTTLSGIAMLIGMIVLAHVQFLGTCTTTR